MKRLSLVLCATFGFFALAQGPVPIPKQLAGPPAEFAEMQPQPMEANGISSKSALLPVQFVQVKNQWVWQSPISIENAEDFHMVVFSGNADWHMRLRAPGMKKSIAVEELYLESRQELYGIEENLVPCQFYHFESGVTGQWMLEVELNGTPQPKRMNEPSGFVMVSSDNPYRLFAHQTTRKNLVGESLGLAAFAYDSRAFDPEEQPMPGSSQIMAATVILKTPSGKTLEWDMSDNGLTGDAQAGDGIFGTEFIAEEMGTYQAQIIAKSMSIDGVAFTRTTEHVIPVAFPDLDLASQVAFTTLKDESHLKIHIPVDTYRDNAERYRVYAEVWGTSPRGDLTPVAWVGGMTPVADDMLTLSLDGRWLGMSDAYEPFQIKNLRIEESGNFIPLVSTDLVDLAIDQIPRNASLPTKTVDESMRMGPRPALPAFKGSGSRLLLVHGYCSGNAWGSVAGQFSNASIFQDFNQNRTHDQFAQLIASYGQTWNSYGIVAHSQGGAAALHLYTYYWSGLDNASGSRLIQSVGTPYQGTALAGNLAAIGAVFGAGCGTNNNLTYSGASSWLSGIPSWARSKVNYYTTSFRDRWWAYDYCHLATDLFLSDPDDGTTEKSKGQLSGGVNRGHKTGWCHTTGMRDAAQTTDSSRNSTMNANAAR